MVRRVLVIGPSGAGKTYVSAALRERGINAVDGDLIGGLLIGMMGMEIKSKFPMMLIRNFLMTTSFFGIGKP